MDTRQQKNPTVSPDEWYTPKWIIDTWGRRTTLDGTKLWEE